MAGAGTDAEAAATITVVAPAPILLHHEHGTVHEPVCALYAEMATRVHTPLAAFR